MGKSLITIFLTIVLTACGGGGWTYKKDGTTQAQSANDDLECTALANKMNNFGEAWELCMKGKGYTVTRK